MTHTPGPWNAFFNERNQATHIGDWCFTNGNSFTPVPLRGVTTANTTAKANARLIAAAPALLAALEEMVAAPDVQPHVKARARAAIAQAKGE